MIVGQQIFPGVMLCCFALFVQYKLGVMQHKMKEDLVPALSAIHLACPRKQDLPLLTHAFHVYPAGMQPATARHLLETVLPGTSVMGDCFVFGIVDVDYDHESRYCAVWRSINQSMARCVPCA